MDQLRVMVQRLAPTQKMVHVERIYTEETFGDYAGLKMVFEVGFVPTLEN